MESALQAPLHPMDCVDVVMASVVGDSDNSGDAFLHIEDMYTRDRSTPLNDAFFDGEDSLVAAYARRQPTLNRTVVMFRRMIRGKRYGLCSIVVSSQNCSLVDVSLRFCF